MNIAKPANCNLCNANSAKPKKKGNTRSHLKKFSVTPSEPLFMGLSGKKVTGNTIFYINARYFIYSLFSRSTPGNIEIGVTCYLLLLNIGRDLMVDRVFRGHTFKNLVLPSATFFFQNQNQGVNGE